MSSRSSPPRAALANSRRTISVVVALGSAAPPAANWSRFNSFLATSRSRPQNATLVAPSGFPRRTEEFGKTAVVGGSAIHRDPVAQVPQEGFGCALCRVGEHDHDRG